MRKEEALKRIDEFSDESSNVVQLETYRRIKQIEKAIATRQSLLDLLEELELNHTT